MTATPFVDRTGDDDTTWQAELARIEAAPACDEGAVERVARAISATRDEHIGGGFPCRCGWVAGFGEGWEKRLDRHRQEAAARAALAAMKSAVTR